MLQRRKKDPYAFDRDSISRFRCIPQQLRGKDEEILQMIAKRENDQLRNASLFVQVSEMECRKFDEMSLTRNDITFLYVSNI